MKYTIEILEYNPSDGFRLEWESGFEISTKVDDAGTIIISANSQGLTSLAKHLLLLAQSSIPSGYHIHLDGSNSLDEGSSELVLERK